MRLLRLAALLVATAHSLRTEPYAAAPFADSLGYSGPFTPLSTSYLAGVADPANHFGPEDKLLVCNDAIVFIDLDSGASSPTQYQYLAGAWSKAAITAVPCPDSADGSLLPRQSGYTVGQTAGPLGDRLLILGGSPGEIDENNVYYSDDCGLTFKCYDGDQIWNSRLYSPVVRAQGILPGDPIVLAGGLSETEQYPPKYVKSVGMFLVRCLQPPFFFLPQRHSAQRAHSLTLPPPPPPTHTTPLPPRTPWLGQSYDMGIHWQRPECELTSNCAHPLSVPDTKGLQCTADHDYYKHCYTLPAVPVLPGSLAADWDTYWLFFEPADTSDTTGRVYHLGAPELASGWVQDVGASDGGYGRKVFIRGALPGTGCWFSTDYLAEDLWVKNDTTSAAVQSMNSFATARSATGPWVAWDDKGLSAPWLPRASAALTTDFAGSAAYLASGMPFVDGVGQAPGFGDVWQIDVGICLLAPSSALVCNGVGTPNLAKVTCTCSAGYAGVFCETVVPLPSSSAGPTPGGSGAASAPAAPAVNVAGAVFGTLLGLGAAAAAVVFLLPTASFVVGGTTVVPAELIKAGAGAAMGAAKAAGAAVGSLVSGGSSAAAAAYTSGGTAPPAPAGEKVSLLAGRTAQL